MKGAKSATSSTATLEAGTDGHNAAYGGASVQLGVERHAHPAGNNAVTVRCHHAVLGEILGHPTQQGARDRIVQEVGQVSAIS
jgi:hypothetical protein